MHAFESLIGSLLERAGYWVRASVKVALTKEEKRAIGRPSAPRWEIDLVGYLPTRNEVLLLECKSYLDSEGVRIEDLASADSTYSDRYKLFTDPRLLPVVGSRLVKQLLAEGGCLPNPTIVLGLAAGRIADATDRGALARLFTERGWVLWTPERIVDELRALAQDGYDNSVASMVAKMLLRPNGTKTV